MGSRATPDTSIILLLLVKAENAEALERRQLLIDVGRDDVGKQRLGGFAALVANAGKRSGGEVRQIVDVYQATDVGGDNAGVQTRAVVQ